MKEYSSHFLFLTYYDYNLFYIKIEKFLILIFTQMTVNGLFFVHESLRRKNATDEGFKFCTKNYPNIIKVNTTIIFKAILCFYL